MKIARGTEAVVSEAEDGPGVAAPARTIPYAYSRDHGILLRAMDGERAAIAMRAGADPTALLEVRR
ncbi:MAG: type II secretion system protein GspE, partial [Parasphingorhabdus sp.]